jgi:type II secretion system protein L
VKRLFLTLPDPLPETLDGLAWRMPGGLPESGVGARPAADEIWLSLPPNRVLLSSLKLSRRAIGQLHGALGNAMEDQLMLDPASSHVALGKVLTGDLRPVAVVEAAWLEQALALCRRQSVEPAGAIPETLLWLAEAESTTWALRWNGQEGYARSGAAAGFALDDGSAEAPPLALRLALADARRKSQAPAAIALETEMEVDLAAWSQALDCPVHAETLHFDARAPAINLLQGPYAPRRHGWLAALAGGEHAGKYRVAAGLAIAALSLQVVGTVADWGRLSWENRKLRDEMRQVFQATFPKTQAIVDPVLQMQRQLSDLRRAHGDAEPGDFLHELAMTSGQVGGVAGLSYDGKRLTLDQPRATDLDGLRAALASHGYQMVAAGEGGARTVSIERSQP